MCQDILCTNKLFCASEKIFCIISASCAYCAFLMATFDYFLDRDECTESPNYCQHGCNNTVGSFICTCEPGYSLRDDGRTCREFSDYSEFLYHLIQCS